MPRFDVTIAGELNLDLILYGLPEQLAPERELLADRMMLTLGSSSAIVAHNLACPRQSRRIPVAHRRRLSWTNRPRTPSPRRSRCVARAHCSRCNHHRTHRDPASRSVAQHPHILGNDCRDIMARSRPRLSCRLAPLPFFFLLPAASIAPESRRIISAAEIEGTHNLSRYQRRSRRPMGRRSERSSAPRRCFPAQ